MKTELLYAAVKKWGRDIQLILAIEEMSELTKELSKWFRGDTSAQKVAEEMCDVYIMLEQLKIVFEISDDEFENLVENKLKRLEGRLEE